MFPRLFLFLLTCPEFGWQLFERKRDVNGIAGLTFSRKLGSSKLGNGCGVSMALPAGTMSTQCHCGDTFALELDSTGYRAAPRKADRNPNPQIYHPKQEASLGAPQMRFEILPTDSEIRAIHKRANTECCSMRRRMADTFRVGLAREQQFDMKEIDVLGESNYQLLALGRNLNQIARHLNEGEYEPVTVARI